MKLNKILIIRTDRLGDCILSTPVIAALKSVNKNAVVDILTSPYTADVFSDNPGANDIIIDDPSKHSIFSKEFRALIKNVAARQYDICFILHITARAALIPFLARIPVRVSPASKIYQFLSTARIRQKRSACELNEAEYNLDLIRRSCGIDFKNQPPRLFYDQAAAGFADSYLDEILMELRNINYDEFKKSGRKLILIHPGSGGSAVNMSPDKYAELIERLYGAGYEIFLSTGPAEEKLRETILSKLSFRPLYYKNGIFTGGSALKRTFALISRCDAAIAPSTGIMHAAAALEKPVVALFCPIFVCAPRRWGPYMPAAAEIITPEAVSSDKNNIINQKYCIKCAGEKCKHYNCMDKIEIKEIIDKLNSVISFV
jgi:lipopolysaccharide heptosyltransferase II